MTAPVAVEGLVVRFGGLVALGGVTLDVRPGQVLGIVGPNGAGKTTLFDAICGFVPVAGGRVLLDGEDVTRLAPHLRAARGLGRSFQDGRLFPALTVEECLALAVCRHVPLPGLLSALAGGPLARRATAAARRRSQEVIELLGLGPWAEAPLRELSTGLRRLVDLACAVAQRPRALLLDEPSAGIAQAEAEALGPLLRRVRAETDCTMLLVEHDLPLVRAVADELVVLEAGRVLRRGLPGEVLRDPEVVRAYAGVERGGRA